MDAYLLLTLLGSALLLISMQPVAFVLFGVVFILVCLRLTGLAVEMLCGR
jgi:hypothetical protein